jgi:hypothetical protein
MSPETPSASASPLEPHRGAQQELVKHINGVRDRLSQEFEPRVPHEVVVREVDLAARSFDGAKITAYVPVLVNRQVRLKLRELVSAA